jgi:voltage-gated potassium channel
MPLSLPRRLYTGLLAIAIVITGGASGYWLIGEGRWSWWECLYMTVISVTTVGYGELLHGMETVPYARAFTALLLILGTGSIVYFASMITAFIVEGELQTLLKTQQLKKRIRRMREHIVVCGAGSTGRNIIEELVAVEVPVVAIDANERTLRELVDKYPRAALTYLVGDATDDEIMAQSAMATARGVVVALSSDKDNLYVVVSARQMNPTARIVARCSEVAHVDKIKRAGADSVVSPNYIGGVRMVSEMLRPTVVRFLDEMLRDKRATYRIEEVTISEGSPLAGASLHAASIRERFGMSVLALKDPGASPWQYNPTADAVLVPGMTVVVLGSSQQVAELRGHASGGGKAHSALAKAGESGASSRPSSS